MLTINSDRLRLKDQITFFTSIHNFLANGFTLEEAIDFYTVVHPQLKTTVDAIKQKLSEGQSFAESIRSLVNFRTYCQLKIAEFHGNLLNALANVSHFLRLKRRQTNKLIGLLIYPAFLIILLTGILTGIRILVTPQLQTFNSGPGHNKLMWVLIGLVPVAVLIYGSWRYCHEQSQVWRLNTLLRIPLFGKVLQAYYAYYLSSNLALMMSCGMDLKQIVKFMNSFRTNQLIRTLSIDVKKYIDHGHRFGILRKKYYFLPKDLMLLLETGDTTDVLAQKLRSYSKMEFKLTVKRSSRLISMLQPVMFLIIGLFIMGTYLSMLLPMYQSIKGVY